MSDLMSRNDEQMKLKFFAMLINFKISRSRGGETISNLP